jgi:hypothetical protein
MPQKSSLEKEKTRSEELEGLAVNGKPFVPISKPGMKTLIDVKIRTLHRASRDLSENLHWIDRMRFCTTSCGQETFIDDSGRCLVCGNPYLAPTLFGTSWPPQEREILIPRAEDLVKNGKIDTKAVERRLSAIELAEEVRQKDREIAELKTKIKTLKNRRGT